MYCEFRDFEGLLLDRLCGVRDVSIQWRLLAKPNLTLKIALNEARATETSIKAMAEIQKDESPNNVHGGNIARQDYNELEESTDEEEDQTQIWRISSHTYLGQQETDIRATMSQLRKKETCPKESSSKFQGRNKKQQQTQQNSVFPPHNGNVVSYINRFKCFLDAADLADISNHRKKAYFLSFCGAAVFDIATALLAPQSVKEVSWEALQEILSNHYAPKPSRIVRQLAFR
ncbi:hypothetical protein E2320_001595, partial [Naja naja]